MHCSTTFLAKDLRTVGRRSRRNVTAVKHLAPCFRTTQILKARIAASRYENTGGEDASEDLVQELSIPELQAITKYRILRNALMQSEQIWGFVSELETERKALGAENFAWTANFIEDWTGINAEDVKYFRQKLVPLERALPRQYWELSESRRAVINEGLDRMAMRAAQAAIKSYSEKPGLGYNLPSPGLVSIGTLCLSGVILLPLTWLLGLHTFDYWALPSSADLQTFAGWTLPYLAALVGFRVLAGDIWYLKADGLGKLGRVPALEGALLWPLLVATKDGFIHRCFLLGIIVSIIGGWGLPPAEWDLARMDESLRANLGSLLPAVASPPQSYLPAQVLVSGFLASFLEHVPWFFNIKLPGILLFTEGCSLRVRTLRWALEKIYSDAVNSTITRKIEECLNGIRTKRSGPGPAMDPDMRALAGAEPVWRGLLRDRSSVLQLEMFQKFATLESYDGSGAEDPPTNDNGPAVLFGAVEAGYLALETLVTHNVLLSIGTQAVGLCVLYIIERLKWLSRDEQQSG